VNRGAVRYMIRPDCAARNEELARNVHGPSSHTQLVPLTAFEADTEQRCEQASIWRTP
jgi:hypothetical protein